MGIEKIPTSKLFCFCVSLGETLMHIHQLNQRLGNTGLHQLAKVIKNLQFVGIYWT
jgi:hypothetical protein